MLTSFLQIAVADTLSMAEQTGEVRMSYWELGLKGGWVMVPIVLLSVLAVYIFFERFFAIRKAAEIDTNFMNRIRDYILDGKVENAMTLCQSYANPVSRMIEKGVQRIGRPLQDISTSIENVGKLEIYKLEKGLPTLATVAGGAPMIGFLGTVMGMIRAFYDMSMSGNNIDVSQLSTGIYMALITTVAGLIVGIIAALLVTVLGLFGDQLKNLFEAIAEKLGDAATQVREENVK
jgi:biopolymer transport protein ExbB